MRDNGRFVSQQNVEIVRTMLETWDTLGIEHATDTLDPDVELVDLQAVMGMQDRGRGPAELDRMAKQWTEIFDDWGLEVSNLVSLGRDSGAPVSNRQFEVYRLVGGKIVEIRVGFRDRDEALEWMGRRRVALSQESQAATPGAASDFTPG